jgi:hypothetical protein
MTRESGRMKLATDRGASTSRWIAALGDHAVAHASFTRFPDRLILEDAAWLPGHARAVRQLAAHECRLQDVATLQVTATSHLVDRLELNVISTELVEKMMVSSLGSREQAAPPPMSHPLLRTDWF